ncbi:MAG: DF family (seleno)protein [Gaiellaceae bacterium]
MSVLVEILYFDGCPNHRAAVALVERVSRELGIEPELRLVNVPDQEAAQRLRFLGSPTVRVGGVDVDPRAQERDDYALSCRVFQTEAGVTGQPSEQWIRDALLGAPRAAA